MSENEASPRVRAIVGAGLSIGGVVLTVVGCRRLLLAADPLQDEALSMTLFGPAMFFFGLAAMLPNVVGFPQRLFQALAITFMALLFDWVAFVPGPRQFHTGSSGLHPGAPVSSTTGRVVFGIVAILMDLFAVYAWRLAIRLLMTGSEVRRRVGDG